MEPGQRRQATVDAQGQRHRERLGGEQRRGRADVAEGRDHGQVDQPVGDQDRARDPEQKRLLALGDEGVAEHGLHAGDRDAAHDQGQHRAAAGVLVTAERDHHLAAEDREADDRQDQDRHRGEGLLHQFLVAAVLEGEPGEHRDQGDHHEVRHPEQRFEGFVGDPVDGEVALAAKQREEEGVEAEVEAVDHQHHPQRHRRHDQRPDPRPLQPDPEPVDGPDEADRERLLEHVAGGEGGGHRERSGVEHDDQAEHRE